VPQRLRSGYLYHGTERAPRPPVMQSRTGPRGNCLAACIATIAGCTIETVDFTTADHPESWDEVARRKLEPLGLTFLHLAGRHLSLWGPSALYIAHGRSPRGLQHAVVYRGQHLLHDPHPEGGGVLDLCGVSFVLPLVRIR